MYKSGPLHSSRTVQKLLLSISTVSYYVTILG